MHPSKAKNNKAPTTIIRHRHFKYDDRAFQRKASTPKLFPGKMEEAEEAFQQMKKLIVDLPYLTTPLPKETLYDTPSIKGPRAGLVLIGPSGVEYTYALRLNFDSTNNEAGSEALLAGLRIARKMKVHTLEAKVDSKLVASQINKEYVASSDRMVKYQAKRYIGSHYPKGYFDLLSKEILGDITQRDIGRYYPKRYWEILPKEILGDTTQRDIGRYYPKRYWEILPKEILGDTTQRDIRSYYPKRYFHVFRQ
ncbi:reverse transcriptase domain-containing protein [Tanacetum coccineum]